MNLPRAIISTPAPRRREALAGADAALAPSAQGVEAEGGRAPNKMPSIAPRRAAAAPQAIEDVTDWYIPDGEPQATRVYPGAAQVSGDLLGHATEIHKIIVARRASGAVARDWRAEYGGVLLRGHTQTTVEGVMHILRRLSRDLPDIDRLGIPDEIRGVLTAPRFGEMGGLVLICGGPGHGKSTTASAAITERVKRTGSFCLCVEDPPEFLLHGDHEAADGRVGKVIQVPAQNESFAEDLRDALRCYPSNARGSMLLIGEIRDSGTAAQALRAAVNGQLVFSTLHASDPIAALERILSLSRDYLGPEESRALLAHSFRGAIEQRLIEGRLRMSFIFSMDSQSPVASRISSGQLRLLVSEIEQQKTFLERGMLMRRLGLAL